MEKVKDRYKYLEGRSQVGITQDIELWAKGISLELGYSEAEVKYVIRFLSRYSSYLMGLGYGFRFRDFMIHPELKFMETEEMYVKDDMLRVLLEYEREVVYCKHFGLDVGVMSEIKTREYMLRGGGIKFRKRIVRKLNSVNDLKYMGISRKRRLIKK